MPHGGFGIAAPLLRGIGGDQRHVAMAVEHHHRGAAHRLITRDTKNGN